MDYIVIRRIMADGPNVYARLVINAEDDTDALRAAQESFAAEGHKVKSVSSWTVIPVVKPVDART